MKMTVTISFLLLSLTATAAADTFVVNNPFDPGDGTCNAFNCTLREAIMAANANPGADTITFNLSGGGVKTIFATSSMTPITETVTIDGYTQPGTQENTLVVGDNAVLFVELDGTMAGLSPIGLNVAADGVVIRGLVINRFSTGININGNGNVIEGNFVGTDVSGTVDLGNTFRGVSITNGDGNLIGGTLPAARNLISGTAGAGVVIFCCDDTDNTIQGNYIGTNRNGTAALPNDENGIVISGTSFANLVGGTTAGAGNLISGNGLNGVEMNGTGSGNVVQGNFIGTDATGTADLGNGVDGVHITGDAAGNQIGGTETGARNLISGNLRGVVISAIGDNKIEGNYIGTDVSGSAALGNTNDGVLVVNSSNNIIGGTVAGAGNLISGNPISIQLGGADNAIQGNLIGTDTSGTSPLGNTGGIIIDGTGTIVGGTGAAGNTIAFCFGVLVNGGSGQHIFGNSIFANSIPGFEAIGINLAGGTEDANGVTANDDGDADTGPNELQNYPVISGFETTSGIQSVEGQLESAPNTDYTLDFYINTEVDPSGYGEGETYLGALDVHTNAQGTVDFSFPLAADAAGKFITATASDPAGNTSEFSLASEAVPPLSRFLNISTRLRVQTGDNVLIGGFIVAGNESKQVIVRAIGPSLGDFGIADPLANPILELHYPDGSTTTNDNWRATQEVEIIATGLAPSDNLESAIVATLDPGNYTAIVRGASGGTGVGLVETYDLSSAVDSALGNISTRGLVETGDNVMIGGIIIGPEEAPSGSILLRAIGPSLSDFGITNPLANPTLELRDGNGALVMANDNWKSTQKAAIEATGLQPSNDLESAILATLASGNYTAIMSGVGGTTGIGLVEAYHLD